MANFSYQYKVHPNAFTLWQPTHAVLNPFAEMKENPYLSAQQIDVARGLTASALAGLAEIARRTSSVAIARAMEHKEY